MEHETFWTLLKDLSHWEFELFISVIFMAIEGLVFWPIINRWREHHREDDYKIAVLKEKVRELEDML